MALIKHFINTHYDILYNVFSFLSFKHQFVLNNLDIFITKIKSYLIKNVS